MQIDTGCRGVCRRGLKSLPPRARAGTRAGAMGRDAADPPPASVSPRGKTRRSGRDDGRPTDPRVAARVFLSMALLSGPCRARTVSNIKTESSPEITSPAERGACHEALGFMFEVPSAASSSLPHRILAPRAAAPEFGHRRSGCAADRSTRPAFAHQPASASIAASRPRAR